VLNGGDEFPDFVMEKVRWLPSARAAAASPRSSDVDRQLEAPALRYEAISDDLCRFDRYPPYLMMKRRETALFGAGLENPYFRVGDGVAGAEITVEGRRCINYASYNYLDFSGDRRVNEAAAAAIARYGTSVSASRLASGERPIHRELEAELAATLGTEDALVFVSGHATNVTVIGHLLGRKDLVLHDELIHNSVLQGCILSGAHRVKIAHNDWAAADAYLAAHRGKFERVLLVIEGIYSMDGDMPDLPRFIEVKRRHKAFLMIDEAHSFGVLGERGFGIGEHFAVAAADVDIWMGTLSKALASCGGYIAGSRALVQYLKYTTPGFLYSVGLSPADAGAALAALRLLHAEPERVARLRRIAAHFLMRAKARGLDTGHSAGSAVVPVVVGASRVALGLSQALLAEGILAAPIIHPVVPESAARVRFFLSAAHTTEQVDDTIDTVGRVLDVLSCAGGRPRPNEPSTCSSAIKGWQ
jgi:8-amino-7-oxononanoate synthase